ncbi:MAG: SDR family NAD(P)-dependent oxidoreductase, partial [Verrucomicrobia bacterium]|nr:SDR family NAD(P)-dependent oxidoreductase [Verrucomicrobiota bacterium]
ELATVIANVSVDQFDVYTYNPWIVTQKFFNFCMHGSFDGIGQLYMNSRYHDWSIAHEVRLVLERRANRTMSDKKTIDNFLRDFSCIIITGCSSGIGRALLTRIGNSDTPALVFNLSRTEPQTISKDLKFTHLTCDLSQPTEIQEVASRLQNLIPRTGRILLVNNSGFGAYGEFPAPDLNHTLKMIEVNVSAPVQLTGLLWERLKSQGGQVANIASLAGYQPTPLISTYAATKAFLLHWSIALDAESKKYGVRCVAVCPGPVSTNFSKAAGLNGPTGLGGQSAEICAEEALKSMALNRPHWITGWKNRWLGFFSARLPKAWAAVIGLRMIQKLKLDRFRH